MMRDSSLVACLVCIAGLYINSSYGQVLIGQSTLMPKAQFYQLGDEMVSGMKNYDMGLVEHYIGCFYMSYTYWLEDFMSTSRYMSNLTFYDKDKIDNLQMHLSELPRTLIDPVKILDAMLMSSGFDPSTFSTDSFVISTVNNYYSQINNGIDRPELIFFRSLIDTLGDGLKYRFNGDLYSEMDDKEIRSLIDSCAPMTYMISHIMPTTTSTWYPPSSQYHGSPVYFYQLGDDMVSGMKNYDMGLVAQYIECFYWSYTHWLDDFMSTSRYMSNVTFYNKDKIDNLQMHLSELPRTLMDPVEMLDAMLKTTGFDPSTFSTDSFVISTVNNYYSQINNGIDRPELIFFRSLIETLGDGLKYRFNGDLYSEMDDKEIRSMIDSCAPITLISSHIMPTTTSTWYPPSSQYHGSPVYFYQLGDDMVSGMKNYDMGLVAQYIECFYWSYTHWLDNFISTSRYMSNVTFYDKDKIDNLQMHLSELPKTLMDPVEMLDAMLKTTGFDPSTFSTDSFVISTVNNYYSQINNGIDRPELIFFRSLIDTLGDGLKYRFNGDIYSEMDDKEIRSLIDSCAPMTYMISLIMPTTMSTWYPPSSQYHGSPVYFYQLGDDMVSGMKNYDMGLVAQYIECFYWSYTHWLDDFMSTSRYMSNVTFYNKDKIDNLQMHLSELPRTLMDPVEMLDAMLKTTGFDPSTFSTDSFVISTVNNYYSQINNGIDRPELIFFRSLIETLGDGLKYRFNGNLYSEMDDKEIRSLIDSCAPMTYMISHIMPTTTSTWYPPSSQYHGSPVYFYQLGDDMVSGMKNYDMGLVAQYIECFYWSYTHWLDDFMSTSRYMSNVTFYNKDKIDNLQMHLSELPRTLMDPVEMLDAMLKTTGFDPSTFSTDSFVISTVNNYYSQINNGIDRPELIFFRSLIETLGDGLKYRFNGDLYSEMDDKEIRSMIDSCAPITLISSHIMPTTTSTWYPPSSQYHGSPVYFYQLGDDMVSGMKNYDMGHVAQYIECFYWSYTHWLDNFMSTSRYMSNVTFYDKDKIDNLQMHLSELPRTLMDPVEMLDAMLKTTGFDPSTFSTDSFVISTVNNYYSQINNGIDRPELIFFRSLIDTLGDGLKYRFNGDLYSEMDDKEIRSMIDSCAPMTYMISHIMPTTTSTWYPPSSQYHGSPVYFYQLGDDMVSGMKNYDMGLVAQYIECFYWSYTHWLDDFMSKSRYMSNVTFYNKDKIDNLQMHFSELPRTLMDQVEMLDAMLKTTGFDPSTFSTDSFVISTVNNYYSQINNGIDRPELIFFRSLIDTLGDGLKYRFNGDLYSEMDDKEIRSMIDSCAPITFMSSHIMPTTTSTWYPPSSQYHGSPVYFYQLGDDMVSGMKNYDVGLVAQYIECFYWSYTHWLDDFMSTSRYMSNVTFYNKDKIDNLQMHLSELPRTLMDPVEMLDAMLKTTGFDPSTFSTDSFVISTVNNYYSQINNGIDRPELIFFRSLIDTLGDGLKYRFNGDLYSEMDDKEIRSLIDSCAPMTYMISHIMPTTTSTWYPPSSQYHGSPVYFYQLGDDMVSGMKNYDMGLVAQYIECFYWSYSHWLDDFMSTSRYMSNVTFYNKDKIDNLQMHLSELPRTLMDQVEMLDAMLKTTGFDPSTFSTDSFVISTVNNYYSQINNGIDRPELIFFRSLIDTLGDGLKYRFNGDLYSEMDDKEIRSMIDSCAPITLMSSHIMPTTTSTWYPPSSQYHGSPVYFYQLGDDMVSGMKNYDMGLVAQYIECFYWSYTHWLDDFMSTSRYMSNVTFYYKDKIDNLQMHLSELPRTLMDPVEMLDAMLKTTGFDPSTFSTDSFVISTVNNYYSQINNGIDRPELIFFRSLIETLGDGLKYRFNGDLYSEMDDKEICSLIDSCAPMTYMISHIMPTTTSTWYPPSSQYHGSPVYFYQLGDDMVSGMKNYDMGLVAQYIECFYWSYTHWLDDFMSTSRYMSNVTFYDKDKIDNLQMHLSELPRRLMDPVEMLDAMLKTTGFDPSTFSTDSFVISTVNNYYSQINNGIDRPELIFFRSLIDTLGDGLKYRFNGDLYSEMDDKEIRSMIDSCAPMTYMISHIMPTTTSTWYPPSSQYHGYPVYFYQLGDDMVSGMKNYDMGLVAQYIECFYWSYTHWLDDFMSTSRYMSNVTFYNKDKIDNLQMHLSELPRTLMDPVEMLDAMLKTTGFDPSTFSTDSFVISTVNNYYSQKNNGIDRPELIFFRSLIDTLGDGLKYRFNGDLYSEMDDKEIRSMIDSCAPITLMSSHIMPTTTSTWYPPSSQYHGSPVYFYQLGDDMVSGMKNYDMGLVAQYIECFYWSYTHWLDNFMSTSRYMSNATFYDKDKIDNLQMHLSELPRTLMDPVEMLDAMLKTTGFDPSTFSTDSFVISTVNNYYSQINHGIDRPELIFFRSLIDTLGDGLKYRFNGDLYSEMNDKEIRSLIDSCAPMTYMISHIMPTTTSTWYPPSSQYHGSPVYFYQLGDDMVSGMKNYDMGLVAQYIECFYWSYTHWLDNFMSTSRYMSNVTFYDKDKIDNLQMHLSELPRTLMDPVEMLDAMLKTTGFDPSTFSTDSFVISTVNNYYSQINNGIDRPELIFFRSLIDTLGDGLKYRFNGDLYSEMDDKEIRSLIDSCAPMTYMISHIMPTTTSTWYPPSSQYHGSPVYFYQLGDDMVSGMKNYDMGLVAQYIECFYWSYTHWLDDFMSTSRYMSNVTFYNKDKIDNLQMHLSELPRTLMDPVEMLDAMLKTTDFDPSTFSTDSFVISTVNNYYSQINNGIDRPELIFFRSLIDTLGDGLKYRFNGDLYSEMDDKEIRLLIDSCAPIAYMYSYIKPTATATALLQRSLFSLSSLFITSSYSGRTPVSNTMSKQVYISTSPYILSSSYTPSVYPSNNHMQSPRSSPQYFFSSLNTAHVIHPTSSQIFTSSSSVGKYIAYGSKLTKSFHQPISHLLSTSFVSYQTSVQNSYTLSPISTSFRQNLLPLQSVSYPVSPTRSLNRLTSSSAHLYSVLGTSLSVGFHTSNSFHIAIMSSSSQVSLTGPTISVGNSILASLSTSRQTTVLWPRSSLGVHTTSRQHVTFYSASRQSSVSGLSKSNAIYPTSSTFFPTLAASSKTLVSTPIISNSVYLTNSRIVSFSSASRQSLASLSTTSYVVNSTSRQVHTSLLTSRKVFVSTTRNVVYPTSSPIATASAKLHQTSVQVLKMSTAIYPSINIFSSTQQSGKVTSKGFYPKSSFATTTSSASRSYTFPMSSLSSLSTKINPSNSHFAALSFSSAYQQTFASSASAAVYQTRSQISMTSSSSNQILVFASSTSNGIIPKSHIATLLSATMHSSISRSGMTNLVYPTISLMATTSSASLTPSVHRSSVVYSTSSLVAAIPSASRQTQLRLSLSSGAYVSTSSATFSTSRQTPPSLSLSTGVYATNNAATSSAYRPSSPSLSPSTGVYATSNATATSTSRITPLSLSLSPGVYTTNYATTSFAYRQSSVRATSMTPGVYTKYSPGAIKSSVSLQTSNTRLMTIPIYATKGTVATFSSASQRFSYFTSSPSNGGYSTSGLVAITTTASRQTSVTLSSSYKQTYVLQSSLQTSVYPSRSLTATTSFATRQYVVTGLSMSSGHNTKTSSPVSTVLLSSGQTTVIGSIHSSGINPTGTTLATTSYSSRQTGVPLVSSGFQQSTTNIVLSSYVSTRILSRSRYTTSSHSTRSLAATTSFTSSFISTSGSQVFTTSSTVSQTSTTTASTAGISCIPGTGFCADPALGSHACNVGPSIYMMVMSFVTLWYALTRLI